jgi:hypothetical protein
MDVTPVFLKIGSELFEIVVEARESLNTNRARAVTHEFDIGDFGETFVAALYPARGITVKRNLERGVVEGGGDAVFKGHNFFAMSFTDKKLNRKEREGRRERKENSMNSLFCMWAVIPAKAGIQ